MVFHVTLAKAEDGWIVAECPALPGCVSQGKDEQEALDNIKEAITAWLWAEDQKAMAQLKPSPDQQQIVVALKHAWADSPTSQGRKLSKLSRRQAGESRVRSEAMW